MASVYFFVALTATLAFLNVFVTALKVWKTMSRVAKLAMWVVVLSAQAFSLWRIHESVDRQNLNLWIFGQLAIQIAAVVLALISCAIVNKVRAKNAQPQPTQ